MPKARWKAAIIGCGGIAGGLDAGARDGSLARTHVTAYRKLPGVDVVAAADVDAGRLKAFAERWKIPSTFPDAGSLLAEAPPDIVSICAPNAEHLALIEACAKAGVKAIWCEKPLGVGASRARRTVELCRERGVILAVNYMRRWLDQALEIKKAVADGTLGRVLSVAGYYTKGICHNGSHTVDLLRFWFGEPKRARLLAAAGEGDDPSVSAALDFGEFSAAVIGLGDPGYSLWELDVVGDKGRARMRNGGADVDWQKVEPSDYPGYLSLSAPAARRSDIDVVFAKVAADVVRALEKGGPLASDGDSALKTLELCERLARDSRRIHEQASPARR